MYLKQDIKNWNENGRIGKIRSFDLPIPIFADNTIIGTCRYPITISDQHYMKVLGLPPEWAVFRDMCMEGLHFGRNV